MTIKEILEVMAYGFVISFAILGFIIVLGQII